MSDNHYIKADRLKELIEDARTKGEPSEELISVISQIARGRLQRANNVGETEDFVQEAIMHVLGKLDRIDLRRNPFSYITSCCWHLFLQTQRRQKHERQKLARYAENRRDKSDFDES